MIGSHDEVAININRSNVPFQFSVSWPSNEDQSVQQTIETPSSIDGTGNTCTNPQWLASGATLTINILAVSDLKETSKDSECSGKDVLSNYEPHFTIIPHFGRKHFCRQNNRDESQAYGDCQTGECGVDLPSGLTQNIYWMTRDEGVEVYPIVVQVPCFQQSCTECHQRLPPCYRCTISVSILYTPEPGPEENQQSPISNHTHSESNSCVVFQEQRVFTLINPPAVTCTLLSGSQYYLLVKVQNHAYSRINVEGLRISVPNLNANKSQSSAVGEEQPQILSKKQENFPIDLASSEVYGFLMEVIVPGAKIVGSEQYYSLMCHLTWSVSSIDQTALLQGLKMPVNSTIRSGELVIRRPGFVITAQPAIDQPVQPKHGFQMQYIIQNRLQDLPGLKLVWCPEKAVYERKAKENPAYCRSIYQVLHNVVCHQPTLDLGQCIEGSRTKVSVEFSLLAPGVYELGQHMKLQLQSSAKASPSKHALYTPTPPGSPYTSHSLLKATGTVGSPILKKQQERIGDIELAAEKLNKVHTTGNSRSSSPLLPAPGPFISKPTPPFNKVVSPSTPTSGPIRRSQVLKRNSQVMSLSTPGSSTA